MRRRGTGAFPAPGNRRGQAVVEFAPILLLMVILLFGVIEEGRLSLAYIALADGARAGVRYGIVHGAHAGSPNGYGLDNSSVTAQVTNITSIAGLTGVAVTISYPANTGGTGSDPQGNQTGDSIKVVASYSYTPGIHLGVFSALTLSSTSQGSICY